MLGRRAGEAHPLPLLPPQVRARRSCRGPPGCFPPRGSQAAPRPRQGGCPAPRLCCFGHILRDPHPPVPLSPRSQPRGPCAMSLLKAGHFPRLGRPTGTRPLPATAHPHPAARGLQAGPGGGGREGPPLAVRSAACSVSPCQAGREGRRAHRRGGCQEAAARPCPVLSPPLCPGTFGFYVAFMALAGLTRKHHGADLPRRLSAAAASQCPELENPRLLLLPPRQGQSCLPVGRAALKQRPLCSQSCC